ncbi:MAG: spore germination protein [Oscillospiraceae bacterium]|nr:spore germination protein [Oscillospiraceae bacterium]
MMGFGKNLGKNNPLEKRKRRDLSSGLEQNQEAAGAYTQQKDSENQKSTPGKKTLQKQNENAQENPPSQKRIPQTISDCQELVQSTFFHSSDLVTQVFDTKLGKILIVYIDGLLNKDLLNRDVVTPLKSDSFDGNIPNCIKTPFTTANDFDSCVSSITNSNILVFYENSGIAYIVDIKAWDKRSVEQPDAESVIRGPKEGFTECLRTNTSLIRRKIKNPALVFEDLQLGRQTNTTISLVYIHGIVNRRILKDIKEQLSKIDIDAVLESGYIEDFLDPNKFSPVSSIGLTQKPDVAASKILEGRVGILCDGTPHVLTIPELFIENIHTSEDYYARIPGASVLRALRLIGLFIGILLPGLSVAIFTFHQEMIQSSFLSHLILSTQKTPLPVSLEAFFLILMFELLREAGTRLPKTVGSAITIVGSLIIGEAAVNAGIVGAPMVIIIALTAVASFIVPNLSEFIMLYRYFFLFLGSVMGLVGIGAGVMILLTQLASTESFGVPILSIKSLKDSIVRFPFQSMKYRPRSIAKDNVRRVK